jgi:hypothetical protein
MADWDSDSGSEWDAKPEIPIPVLTAIQSPPSPPPIIKPLDLAILKRILDEEAFREEKRKDKKAK